MVNWQPYAYVYHNLSRITRANQVHCNKVAYFLSRHVEGMENWEEISSSESAPLGTEPMPPAPVFEGPDPVTGWLYDGSQWRNYIPPGEFAVHTPTATADAEQV